MSRLIEQQTQQRPDFWENNDAWWQDLLVRHPPQTGLDERKPDSCVGEPLWRGLKKSIVKAAQAGTINEPTAERLVERFHLKDV